MNYFELTVSGIELIACKQNCNSNNIIKKCKNCSKEKLKDKKQILVNKINAVT